MGPRPLAGELGGLEEPTVRVLLIDVLAFELWGSELFHEELGTRNELVLSEGRVEDEGLVLRLREDV